MRQLRRRQAKALREHEAAKERHQQELEAYKADLNDWRRGGRKQGESPPDRPTPPVCQRLIVSDTTIEALADRLADNSRGLLLQRDELRGWLDSFNQYKQGRGPDVAHWLTIHGARDLLVDRKTGEKTTIYAPRAAVSITGGIQPAILRQAFGQKHFEDGLAARLLLAMPPRKFKRWTEAEISLADEQAMGEV